MPLRALNNSPAQAYNSIIGQAVGLKQVVDQRLTRWSGPTKVDQVYITHWDIRNRVIEIERMLPVSDLAAYAASQISDPTYDFIAEATAVVAAGRAAMAVIRARVPDRRGEVINASGDGVDFAQLGGADLNAVRNSMQAVSDLIV